MPAHLPVRRGGHAKRKQIRRASRPLSQIQAAALAIMLACLVLGGALIVAPSFRLGHLQLDGARFTSRAAVEAVTGLDVGSSANAFDFRSDEVAARLVRLPAVEAAHVSVKLPSTLDVTLTERTPKLIWTIGSKHYVIDQTGLLFGLVDDAGRPVASDAGPLPVPTASPPPSPTPATTPRASTASPTVSPTASARPAPSLAPLPSGAPRPSLQVPAVAAPAPAEQGGLGLPLVVDRRADDAKLGLGDTIDPTTADAAYRIATLEPAEIGSSATRLVVVVDDTYGISLTPAGGGWVAEFGFFTSRRPTEGIPSQVRALHALFANAAIGEAKVAWVYLLGDIPGGQDSYVPR